MCGPKHPEEIVEQKRRDFLADIASVCKRHGVKFADQFRWEPYMFQDFPEFESEPVTESGHCFIVDLGDIEEAIRLAHNDRIQACRRERHGTQKPRARRLA